MKHILFYGNLEKLGDTKTLLQNDAQQKDIKDIKQSNAL
jgi:hypothetical protein